MVRGLFEWGFFWPMGVIFSIIMKIVHLKDT